MTASETEHGGGIASRIREARLAAGLTQGQLAARVGVTVQTVRGWEAGRWKPHLRAPSWDRRALRDGSA